MPLRKLSAFVMLAALVGGCASNTGVIDAGNGQYVIEKQKATGLPGLGNLRAEVYSDAKMFCSGKGRNFSTITYEEAKPPYILGNYPRVSLMFKCG